MIDANFAYAFTAGMVATVNPCGFAMLPAYLGYFLGIQGDDTTETTAGLVRALVVGAVVSAGFLAVFAGAGALVSWGSVSVGEWSPWLTVVIGVVLVAAGAALALGWEPKVLLPRLDKGGRDRGLWSMFLFGVSYAVASLSCTLPVFSSVVASTFSRDSFVSGLATFVAYAAGMALLLMVLTVTLAVARRGLVTGLRRALPHVQRVSGVIMAIMGAYLTWYGIYEIRLQRQGPVADSGPFDLVNHWSAAAQDRLDSLDALQVALALGLVVAVVVLIALLRAPRSGEKATTTDHR
ncbi:MAG: putative cytochrome c biosis protein [Acidimicrobiales bacterium]|nr:putative cytochrome c biosis protein [Acidimicrobiales bacterium]